MQARHHVIITTIVTTIIAADETITRAIATTQGNLPSPSLV
jgi:hypothetical protein